MPRAGDLVERVRFERRGKLDDGFGNEIAGPWAAQFERAAMFIMRPGSEAVTAARLHGQQPVTIIVRFDTQTRAVTPDWRVVDVRTGTAYAIRAAEDMDRTRTWISLVCIAGEPT